MTHIMENKDNFYSSFKKVSKSEDKKENLIECCARYFQGANYNTDSVDVCIAAIVKTLGVNLNLFQKDPRTKLITLTKYDCNKYKSTVNLFIHYYPGCTFQLLCKQSILQTKCCCHIFKDGKDHRRGGGRGIIEKTK